MLIGNEVHVEDKAYKVLGYEMTKDTGILFKDVWNSLLLLTTFKVIVKKKMTGSG